jgi:hypothetical protein
VVTVFVKGAKPENVSIHFEPENVCPQFDVSAIPFSFLSLPNYYYLQLNISVQLSTDKQFLLDLDLAHEIDPAQSKFEIMSTKIGIILYSVF